MNVQLCQRMLCDHGVFPREVLNRSLKERIFMSLLYRKEHKEFEEAKKHRKNQRNTDINRRLFGLLPDFY